MTGNPLNDTLDSGTKNIIKLIIAALLGGGGASLVAPKLVPQWYRPDPATGAELRDVRRELDSLRRDVDRFLIDGPRRVTENQTKMIQKMDTLLLEIRARGAEHRAADR